MIQVRACFDDVLWFQFGGFRKQIVFCLWCCKTGTCGNFETGVLRQSRVAHSGF